MLANDSDPNGDAVSIAAVSIPAHGDATVLAGTIVYTPLASYAGPDVFSYSISDGHGGLSTDAVKGLSIGSAMVLIGAALCLVRRRVYPAEPSVTQSFRPFDEDR